MELWQKLKQNKIAFSFICLLAFIAFTSIFAPFLGNNKPFIIHTQNKLIYIDYLDSALENLKTVSLDIKQNRPTDPKILSWLEKSLSETAAFIKEVELAEGIMRINLNKSVQTQDLSSLYELSLLLEKARTAELKKRFFFPLFNTLRANDFFFMLLLPLYLLIILIKKYLPQKIIFKFGLEGFWEKVFAVVLLSLFITILIMAMKQERFDPIIIKKCCPNLKPASGLFSR